MIKIKSQHVIPLALCGLAAGLINGLLGAGGGIVIVFALGRLTQKVSLPDGSRFDSRDLLANALLAMLPVTVISLIGYASEGSVSLFDNRRLILPAILGGSAGALLLDRISVNAARRIFTVIVILSGILMLVRDGGGHP